MNEYATYEKLRDAGGKPDDIYLAMKADGLDYLERLKLLRLLFDLSLVESKEIAVIADGLATSLDVYQQKFVPALKEFLEKDENDSGVDSV